MYILYSKVIDDSKRYSDEKNKQVAHKISPISELGRQYCSQKANCKISIF